MIDVSVRETLSRVKKVLVLWPVPGRSLQTRFHGLCIVEKQLDPGDYVIALPDHQKTKSICRANMLTKYHERDPTLDSRDHVGQSKHIMKLGVVGCCKATLYELLFWYC